jgi:hypothetical protein
MKTIGEVIELSKFVPTPKEPLATWRERKESHPFAIFFVYAPEGFFVVKGRSDEVEKYIKARFPKYVARYTFWKDGESRGNWTSNLPLYWSREYNRNNFRSTKYYVLHMNTATGFKENLLRVRRIPKGWLPIYDQAEFKKPTPVLPIPQQFQSSRNNMNTLSLREKRSLGLNKNGEKSVVGIDFRVESA